MGFFDKLEHGLERSVNGLFAKTFKSGVQPVELTAALRRELDTRANVVSRERILVPNIFQIMLSRNDFDRMSGLGESLTNELTNALTTHAVSQGYQFPGPLNVSLVLEVDRPVGVVSIFSESVVGEVTWSGTLEIAGKRYPLSPGRTVLGRGTEADITIEDSSISRKHLEVLWDGKRAEAHDLGSTNGSMLNGVKFRKAALSSGNVITIGSSRISYALIPESRETQSSRGDAG